MNRPLRLLFVTETYPSGLSGSSVKTRSTLEFLLRRGHLIDVACVDFQSLARKELKHPGLRIFSVYKLGIRVLRLGLIVRLIQLIFSFKPVIVARIFDARLQVLVDTLLYSQNYDYVFFEGFSCLQYIQYKHKKFIYIDHEDITGLMQLRFRAEKNWIMKIFYLTEYLRCLHFEKRTLSFVQQIWAISPQTQKRLSSISPAQTLLMPTVIPVGINVFNSKSRNLVFSGSLSWPENKNGLTWFLRNCWTEIFNKFPNTVFYITGQQADSRLMRLFRQYPNVRFMGFVKALERVYKRAGIAISPIFINRGIKVKILTYMKHGLPVVVTEESARGIRFDGGVVVAEKNNFAATIIQLLLNDSQRQQLSKACYASMKKYYSEKTLARFFENVAKIPV